ncbi:hypothetical protein DFR58_1458 [Anaerobacterium chartisolvens]|uniref:DUF2087 domain-containing protein n=1 Tax=Anaerobacterium chartisolvens TaxID=1297424 RepID=A0A369AJ37_9FIRM|nr:DUF2087 domain-containing protein [Anaerobacterium chartisolvens]RCX08167.1 hypothetical protein DFR58_1458 [Anaerobacterium chartisolvens]
MKLSDMLWNAAPAELARGYLEEGDFYICLVCGKKFEKGIIYPQGGVFYEAKRYIRVHIDTEHGPVFEYLINLDKKLTGLSEHQKALLKLFYQGKRDCEIQQAMDIGSSSTIRNHRFVLKEKERQARVFIAIMDLLKENIKKTSELVPPHNTATMRDDRYNITAGEYQEVLKKYFPDGPGGGLKTFSMREKSKLVVLREIAKRFEPDREYSEKQVNQILEGVYEDFATIRRYLIEYGFMDRKPDGSRYRLKEEPDGRKETEMDRRKQLIREYKETKTQAGVFQIRNTKNGKVYVEAIPNLKMMNGRLSILRGGTHKNAQLQEEWNRLGEETFVFEVLEVLEEKEEGFFDKKDELKKLESKWLEKLKPYGDKGYNRQKD